MSLKESFSLNIELGPGILLVQFSGLMFLQHLVHLELFSKWHMPAWYSGNTMPCLLAAVVAIKTFYSAALVKKDATCACTCSISLFFPGFLDPCISPELSALELLTSGIAFVKHVPASQTKPQPC